MDALRRAVVALEAAEDAMRDAAAAMRAISPEGRAHAAELEGAAAIVAAWLRELRQQEINAAALARGGCE
jgi:hypothetical protein